MGMGLGTKREPGVRGLQSSEETGKGERSPLCPRVLVGRAASTLLRGRAQGAHSVSPPLRAVAQCEDYSPGTSGVGGGACSSHHTGPQHL